MAISATDLKKKRLVVIKFLPYDDGSRSSVDLEIKSLKRATKELDPRYLTSFYEAKEVSGMMAIVMELVSGVNLSSFIRINSQKGITEGKVQNVFRIVFKGTFVRYQSTLIFE